MNSGEAYRGRKSGEVGPLRLWDGDVSLKERIKQARLQLQGAFDQEPEGLVFLDLDFRATFLDAPALALLNAVADQSLGAIAFDLFEPRDRSTVEMALASPGDPFELLGATYSPLQIACIEWADGLVIGLVRPTAPLQRDTPRPAQTSSNQPVDPDTTTFFETSADCRNLAELAHVLLAWMRHQAPRTSGVLAVPTHGTLVPVATWNKGASMANMSPVPLGDCRAVRQGRAISLEPGDHDPILPDSTELQTLLPIYRGERLVCVIGGSVDPAILEKIGYACGLQIQRLA